MCLYVIVIEKKQETMFVLRIYSTFSVQYLWRIHNGFHTRTTAFPREIPRSAKNRRTLGHFYPPRSLGKILVFIMNPGR